MGRFLSRWFEVRERGWIEDRESKARKQREELTGQLRRDVDRIGRNLRKKLTLAIGSTKTSTPAARDVIREDLRKVLVPFSPEELRASFVDAELALSARAEQDEEVSKVYRRKSGFDDFLDNLNAFVAEKRLTARYTTSLYTLDQVLREAPCS